MLQKRVLQHKLKIDRDVFYTVNHIDIIHLGDGKYRTIHGNEYHLYKKQLPDGYWTIKDLDAKAKEAIGKYEAINSIEAKIKKMNKWWEALLLKEKSNNGMPVYLHKDWQWYYITLGVSQFENLSYGDELYNSTVVGVTVDDKWNITNLDDAIKAAEKQYNGKKFELLKGKVKDMYFRSSIEYKEVEVGGEKMDVEIYKHIWFGWWTEYWLRIDTNLWDWVPDDQTAVKLSDNPNEWTIQDLDNKVVEAIKRYGEIEKKPGFTDKLHGESMLAIEAISNLGDDVKDFVRGLIESWYNLIFEDANRIIIEGLLNI